jgi:hypothetical protein
MRAGQISGQSSLPNGEKLVDGSLVTLQAHDILAARMIEIVQRRGELPVMQSWDFDLGLESHRHQGGANSSRLFLKLRLAASFPPDVRAQAAQTAAQKINLLKHNRRKAYDDDS